MQCCCCCCCFVGEWHLTVIYGRATDNPPNAKAKAKAKPKPNPMPNGKCKSRAEGARLSHQSHPLGFQFIYSRSPCIYTSKYISMPQMLQFRAKTLACAIIFYRKSPALHSSHNSKRLLRIAVMWWGPAPPPGRLPLAAPFSTAQRGVKLPGLLPQFQRHSAPLTFCQFQ